MIDAVIGAGSIARLACDGCRKEAEIVLWFTRSATRDEPVIVVALCYKCADEAREVMGARPVVSDAAQLSLEAIGARL